MKKKFVPTEEMIAAAETVFKAMAYEQTIRPIVEGYQNKILNERQWLYMEKYRDSLGTVITEIRSAFLMSIDDYSEFAKRCNEEREKSGLVVESSNFCPLLVAERLLVEAKFELVKAMQEVTKIPVIQMRAAPLKTFHEFVELTLSLMSPFVAPTLT